MSIAEESLEHTVSINDGFRLTRVLLSWTKRIHLCKGSRTKAHLSDKSAISTITNLHRYFHALVSTITSLNYMPDINDIDVDSMAYCKVLAVSPHCFCYVRLVVVLKTSAPEKRKHQAFLHYQTCSDARTNLPAFKLLMVL